MTRFSVKSAETDETELKDIIPAIDSNNKTSNTNVEEHEEPPVTLRVPKSALLNSSIVKDDEISPKEVRFNIEQQRKSILAGL